ncbi:siroheme synthase CysG [Acetobacter oeni]|uniref:Siroheme synthase n=1 Tax=Acetobacter oeni TaxID=304077 RepID=A0A511XIJ0_9PROT|nr:siroheme synthase CysG [Acetobacter oeni]MBB3881482.1 uroporphyrin-III C-methyltransferase/precorrin-2 dehydrogenase/sirohydrochlorin ferrochelatase [Acetobacter oeni]NHO18347.1 uroporphyrinogen-III C-methyltransferase [Acetobacter oeni]GBR10857.1 siroheme synthase [Acetobacter oeni LMG 21952]GEN62760.1 siroheme synthase [Acetobacter oeni]
MTEAAPGAEALMPWFPVTLRMDSAASALVVGGGGIAANKVALLATTEAAITVLSPDLNAELVRLVARGRISHDPVPVSREVLGKHLPGKRLVFAATNDRAVNRLVAEMARGMNIPVCAVDDPDPSTFITPAIVRRPPVLVAISTAGAAPVLARRLREQIESLLPAQLGRMARFMQRLRPAVAALHPVAETRRRVWERFLDGIGSEQALAGDEAGARLTLEREARGETGSGEVWLVGAGPGDADLLTLKALRLMQNADSVLYDHLLPPEILERVRRDAERVFVGKQRSDHALPQPAINDELIRRARAGERVLRLKGGDPFIFGRGGEEIEALMAADIPFRIVPGISAANGCAASAGIPLTHRDCAQSCLFLTGHARADGTLDLPWDTIARRGQTVVIYMGLGGIAMLCERLMRHGLPPDWPAAVVEKGTQPDQRVVVGDLRSLPEQVMAEVFRSPSLIIVGEVVRHRVVSRSVSPDVTAGTGGGPPEVV